MRHAELLFKVSGMKTGVPLQQPPSFQSALMPGSDGKLPQGSILEADSPEPTLLKVVVLDPA